jgi:hypothetical protein
MYEKSWYSRKSGHSKKLVRKGIPVIISEIEFAAPFTNANQWITGVMVTTTTMLTITC